MAWRTVLIQNASKLSLSKGQLKISNEEGDFTLPLEDIFILILESSHIILTSSLLSACQDNCIGVVTCDAGHMPNGILLPFHPHSRQTRISHLQIGWSETLRKRLWQKIIQAKIRNQAACLAALTDERQAARLQALAKKVASGDPENIEAQAARDYWPKLFGTRFRRNEPHIINSALNYSYAVLRAMIARSQVSYGLLPCFGLHHSNALNAFNLTDDVMEILRPTIDAHIYAIIHSDYFDPNAETLSVAHRQKLANIGALQVRYAGQIFTLTAVSDKLSAGLITAIETKSAMVFTTPEFITANHSLAGEHER